MIVESEWSEDKRAAYCLASRSISVDVKWFVRRCNVRPVQTDFSRLTLADWSADWPVDWLCGRGRAGMRRRLVECARECASMCKIVGPNRSIFSVFHRNEPSKWGIGLKFHRKQKWKRKQILNTLVKRMSANWEEFSKQKLIYYLSFLKKVS